MGRKPTTTQLPGALATGNMGGLVRVDPGVTNLQARIIPDATPKNSGVMTQTQAAQLAALVAGGGGGGSGMPRFTVLSTAVNGSVDYGQLMEADPTGGHINITFPRASDVTPTGPNVFIVKNVGLANTVGLRLAVGDGIDNGVTALTVGQYGIFVSDGVNTFIVVSENNLSLTLTGVQVGAYNANPNEYVQADSTIGNISVTLPTAADAGFGGQVWIKNKTDNVNTVTVLPAGADTIDGGASALVGGLEILRLVSDGVSDWMVS